MKAEASPKRDPGQKSDLLDSIEDEVDRAFVLLDMVHAIADVMVAHEHDYDDDGPEQIQTVFAGIAVVADDVHQRIEAIRSKARRLHTWPKVDPDYN